MERLVIGSDELKELFCRVFIATHDPYDPQRLEWPELDEQSVQRLRAMPFWDEAISTESDVAKKVQALGPLEPDPLLREAIQLQGYEEGRHAALLHEMIRHYGIPEPTITDEVQHPDPVWNFLRMGYGECFDSFFAFGLFKLAGDSGLFPEALLRAVAPIVQEEARHILFFANWVAYCRARQPWYRQPLHRADCALAMLLQVWARIKTARGAASAGDNDFMLGVQESLDVTKSPRQLVETCLRENDRRLGEYDPRLLRPTFVPTLARGLARVLPRAA